MDITIGMKIKELRKKHNLTQEQLADYLGITFQSISKWEDNIALPDISLIPSLAAFFNISIDELFDFNLKGIKDNVKSICEEAYKYRCQEEFEKSKEILTKGLEKYPNNEDLLDGYLYTINYKEHPDEMIATAGKLASETTNDSIKYNALRFLSYAYYAKGEIEYARATIQQLPDIHFNKLSELAFVLEGKEKYDAANKQKWNSIECLLQMMFKIFEYYISCDEIVKAVDELNSAIRVIDIFNDSRFENYRTFFTNKLLKLKEIGNYGE